MNKCPTDMPNWCLPEKAGFLVKCGLGGCYSVGSGACMEVERAGDSEPAPNFELTNY